MLRLGVVAIEGAASSAARITPCRQGTSISLSRPGSPTTIGASAPRSSVGPRPAPCDRERLEAVAADRNSAWKHVWRARIILATAEGCGTTAIMRRAGVSKPCVWRWQRRCMEKGVDGVLRDRTRKPGKAPVPAAVVAHLIERTLGPPPGETTHGTRRAMARLTGLAVSTVQRIRRAHGLAPHWPRAFKLGNDRGAGPGR